MNHINYKLRLIYTERDEKASAITKIILSIVYYS
jgi:hypothetical protein